MLKELARRVGTFVSVQVEILSAFDPPEESFDAVRGQYHAGVLLKHLSAHYPGYFRVVGITSYDLFLPIFTHVYGEAQMDGHAALVSLFRLAEHDANRVVERELLPDRALKVALHELMHTFGLVHCRHLACLMRPVIKIVDLDDLSPQLCRSCRNSCEQVLSLF